MKFISSRVAEEIREAREEQGLSQSALAARVRSTRASISNIERGNQSLSLDLFCRIAEALDIYPPDLLSRVLKGERQHVLLEVRDEKIRKIIEDAVN